MALPRDFKADYAADSEAMIRRGITTPVIIGANTFDAVHDEAFNSALLLDGNGVVRGRYDKVRLLAFGEYIPGIDYFPWLKKFIPAGAGGFTAGAGPVVMPLQGPAQQILGNRSGDLLRRYLARFIRQLGKLHPNLLVNLTSDSWFGADTEPWEHLALAVFATIELRVGMVRAVNSGVSALIDPNGRLLQKTYADDPYRRPHAADGVIVNVPRMAGEPTRVRHVRQLVSVPVHGGHPMDGYPRKEGPQPGRGPLDTQAGPLESGGHPRKC